MPNEFDDRGPDPNHDRPYENPQAPRPFDPAAPSAFQGHEFSNEPVETVLAPGFDDPIIDPETGEVTVLVRNRDEEDRAVAEKVDLSTEYPKRVKLHESHTVVQRRVPMQGFLRDSETGHLKGIEQAPPVVSFPGEWPKWVLVHESHVVKQGEHNEVVQGFEEAHRDRSNGKFSVLVRNPEDEKRALGAKVDDGRGVEGKAYAAPEDAFQLRPANDDKNPHGQTALPGDIAAMHAADQKKSADKAEAERRQSPQPFVKPIPGTAEPEKKVLEPAQD